MKKFATCFNQADVLITTEIYRAGENPIPGVSGQVLYEEIQKYGHKNIHFEPDLNKIPSLLSQVIHPDDIILFMGAGNIYTIIPEVEKILGGR